MMEMKMWMKMKAMEDSLESDTKTSNKMRVLLAVAALFVAGALAGGKEMMEMKMWMKMKAMEGCFGEDVMKTHMIKMKKAAATCMRKDAPELDLPLFNNEFRLANVLTRRWRPSSATSPACSGSATSSTPRTSSTRTASRRRETSTSRCSRASGSEPSSPSTATSASSSPRPCPKACWTNAPGVERWSKSSST